MKVLRMNPMDVRYDKRKYLEGKEIEFIGSGPLRSPKFRFVNEEDLNAYLDNTYDEPDEEREYLKKNGLTFCCPFKTDEGEITVGWRPDAEQE